MGSRERVRQAREGGIGLRDFWKSGVVLTCSGEQDLPCVGEGSPSSVYRASTAGSGRGSHRGGEKGQAQPRRVPRSLRVEAFAPRPLDVNLEPWHLPHPIVPHPARVTGPISSS